MTDSMRCLRKCGNHSGWINRTKCWTTRIRVIRDVNLRASGAAAWTPVEMVSRPRNVRLQTMAFVCDERIIGSACRSARARYGSTSLVAITRMSEATDARDEGFERDVRAALAFISHDTPTVSASSYAPQSFGNAMVELEGDAIRVRVTRDRGQFF